MLRGLHVHLGFLLESPEPAVTIAHAAALVNVPTPARFGPDRSGLAITAIALDHYYTSIEPSLGIIGRVFDSMRPTGADWQRALLLSATAGKIPAPDFGKPTCVGSD